MCKYISLYIICLFEGRRESLYAASGVVIFFLVRVGWGEGTAAAVHQHSVLIGLAEALDNGLFPPGLVSFPRRPFSCKMLENKGQIGTFHQITVCCMCVVRKP